VQWNKVTLVGVGLLGGSLGLALKQGRLARKVVGFVRREASVKECRRFKATDSATLDLHSAVEGADLIVLCTPLSQMRALAQRMLPSVKRGAIVTDVGSVKGSMVKDLDPIFARAGAHFVGSHPMAGGERMGVSAARGDLFRRAVCVVTPTRKTHKLALKKVEKLWASVGCRVLRLAPELHDQLVSRSSHLPHVVAAELANYVLNASPKSEQAALCANGFRDTTRIASGSPEMWRDIALANRKNLDLALGQFIKDLEKFQRALKGKRAKAISDFFDQAKERRDHWASQAASTSPE
jgi:prephenate dehydrogenase